MTAPLAPDPILVAARARAAAGAWSEVLGLLEPRHLTSGGEPEYATLYGAALIHTGHVREARLWLAEAERKLSRQADHAAHRAVVNMLGAACFTLGALDDASSAFETAMELGQRGDDLLLVARASNNLGALANLRGQHERAVWHYELAIPAYQRLGQSQGLAESYHNLAITHRDLRSLDRADECERRAIEFAGEAGAPRLAAMARLGRAEISLRRGDAVLADAAARRAARELAALGDRSNEADAYRLVGAACTAQRRWDDARAAFERALAMARSGGFALVEAETLRDRARLEAAEGKPAAARRTGGEALAAFRKLGAADECAELERWADDELDAASAD